MQEVLLHAKEAFFHAKIPSPVLGPQDTATQRNTTQHNTTHAATPTTPRLHGTQKKAFQPNATKRNAQPKTRRGFLRNLPVLFLLHGSGSIAGTMADTAVARDSVYSFEVARRAVGRAALHLGIDSMTEQSLDVMADVLLQYLARTGRALSHLAESSRRTSAHVNVLDAFQACQLVTAPAVGRLHLPAEDDDDVPTEAAPASSSDAADSSSPPGGAVGGGSGNGGASDPPSSLAAASSAGPPGSGSSAASQSSTGWKGLAAFVFGPRWLEEKDEEDCRMEQSIAAADAVAGDTADDGPASSGGGGKVFPSSLDGNGGAGELSGELDGTQGRRRKRRGWDAPYPDGVPLFPRASPTCANPHALPARLTGGLSSSSRRFYRKVEVAAEEAAEDETEALEELEALPDGVFVEAPEEGDMAAVHGSSWGSLDGRHKRNPGPPGSKNGGRASKDQDGDVEMEPATKKTKLGTEQDGAQGAKPGGPKGGSGEGEENDDALSDEFVYVPSFYPRPPSTKVVVDDRRTVVDETDDEEQRLLQQTRTQLRQEQQVSYASSLAARAFPGAALRDTIDIDSSRGVRTSLVQLGSGHSHYWGSGWDEAAPKGQRPASASAIAVPMGRKPAASGNTVPLGEPILPMSRASGSRVSRVLEGSMDAAAMQ
ncbi:unnamed protein product [Pseudo-nitzschia multistriata]|uniref:Bromodomain associated domain-containing protein n=1 Tax=Pseudo-nitzschia multistriata TaxID=183589 RepID=A0A448ZHB5_9STRA|nr:unnamed protein product [Pseudo-nitzschia multistriata]